MHEASIETLDRAAMVKARQVRELTATGDDDRAEIARAKMTDMQETIRMLREDR